MVIHFEFTTLSFYDPILHPFLDSNLQRWTDRGGVDEVLHVGVRILKETRYLFQRLWAPVKLERHVIYHCLYVVLLYRGDDSVEL
jgi:hypothetical protein